MNAEGRIIATDLDGTLFYPKKFFRLLTKENIEFLREFVASKGRLVLVSGRNKAFINDIYKELKCPFDAIGCNSGFISVDNKLIKEKFIDNSRIKQVLKEIKEKFRYTGIFLMTKKFNMLVPIWKFWFIHRVGFTIYQYSIGRRKEHYKKSDKILQEELNSGKIYKVMLFFGVTNPTKKRTIEINKELNTLYPDLEFSWCEQAIEINPKGVTKAEGIKEYLDYLKIEKDKVFVVGDSGNDISMFREFDNSFCMNHASNSVKKYAKHTINQISDLKKYL